MNVLILGTGFGAFHAELYRNNPAVKGITLWGRNSAKLQELKETLGVSVTTDLELALGDDAIDLVDICLPNRLHAEYIGRAVAHGKHVFCETPLCDTAADAQAIQRILDCSDRRVFVDQFIKFFPEYRYVQQAVESGTYGELMSLQLWRKTPAIWGPLGVDSIASNLMIHELDFVSWLCGEAPRPEAVAVRKNTAECHVQANARCGQALVSVCADSMMPASYPFSTGFNAVFQRAAVEFRGQFPDGDPIKHTMLYTADGCTALALPQIHPYQAAIDHVVSRCADGLPSELDARHALASARLALAIREQIA